MGKNNTGTLLLFEYCGSYPKIWNTRKYLGCGRLAQEPSRHGTLGAIRAVGIQARNLVTSITQLQTWDTRSYQGCGNLGQEPCYWYYTTVDGTLGAMRAVGIQDRNLVTGITQLQTWDTRSYQGCGNLGQEPTSYWYYITVDMGYQEL